MGMSVEKRSFVICKEPGRYIGWPTIARTKDGELLVAFSGDRAEHVCPFGKTQLVRSRDGGATWSEPLTISKTPLDDRDAGILVTSKGAVLVTWFTSLAFEEYSPNRWKKESAAILDADRRKWLGNWTRRSTDGGQTWSDPTDSIVSTPHGPIELRDGRLLYFGINSRVGSNKSPEPSAAQRIAAAESRDDGKTWTLTGFVPIPKEAPPGGFHEPHVVETADGKLVGMIRHEGQPHDSVLWQTDSADGGKTWSEARPTKIWGLPPHLIRLRDGRILVTYGHRRAPFGQRACLSRDGGATWDLDRELLIRDDAPNGDLGYPASVQMDDQTVLTIYYQIDKPGEKTCLMGTSWKLPKAE
ncbi:MAG: sialidase family protein [Planctomycetota bacterium]|nr:sialidase family protein [Planctomycetota bacterium]